MLQDHESPPAITMQKEEKYRQVCKDAIEVKIPFIVNDCVVLRGETSGGFKIMAEKERVINGKKVIETIEGVGHNLDTAIKDFKKKY